MRKMKWLLTIILFMATIYFAGPHPSPPRYDKTLPAVPSAADELERYISAKEAMHKLRPDNQARIVWADSSHSKTPYAIVYLHGFSASQAEGDPVHRNIAARFHCNLYLSRLAEHGIDTTEQLVNMTADEYWESAKEAYAIAKNLGEKVIIMGTSTGGTLALLLAASYPEVYALELLSPNIEIFDNTARILNNPWGLQIARLVTGSHYIYSHDTRPIYKQYWNYGYREEALVQLEEMLETSMTPETFKKVTQPVLLLYYFKDKVHQDSVVKVEAMQRMYSQISTSQNKKRSIAMPLTGNHVIGSYIKSRDIEGVSNQIEKFMQEVLHIQIRNQEETNNVRQIVPNH